MHGNAGHILHVTALVRFGVANLLSAGGATDSGHLNGQPQYLIPVLLLLRRKQKFLAAVSAFPALVHVPQRRPVGVVLSVSREIRFDRPWRHVLQNVLVVFLSRPDFPTGIGVTNRRFSVAAHDWDVIRDCFSRVSLRGR